VVDERLTRPCLRHSAHPKFITIPSSTAFCSHSCMEKAPGAAEGRRTSAKEGHSHAQSPHPFHLEKGDPIAVMGEGDEVGDSCAPPWAELAACWSCRCVCENLLRAGLVRPFPLNGQPFERQSPVDVSRV
jgi:hypothetical protein